jgi:hypothetical protein
VVFLVAIALIATTKRGTSSKIVVASVYKRITLVENNSRSAFALQWNVLSVTGYWATLALLASRARIKWGGFRYLSA